MIWSTFSPNWSSKSAKNVVKISLTTIGAVLAISALILSDDSPEVEVITLIGVFSMGVSSLTLSLTSPLTSLSFSFPSHLKVISNS